MNHVLTQSILNFLCNCGVSTTANMATVLQNNIPDTLSILQRLEQEQWIQNYPHVQNWSGFQLLEPDLLAGSDTVANADQLWCISSRSRPFCKDTPATVPALRFLNHHLLLQTLEVRSIQQCWVQQWHGERYTRMQSWPKVPDALCINSTGARLALELELSLKPHWRYQEAFDHYALLFHEQQVDHVIYLLPAFLEKRLWRQLERIEYIYMFGQMIRIPHHLRNRFHIIGLHHAYQYCCFEHDCLAQSSIAV